MANNNRGELPPKKSKSPARGHTPLGGRFIRSSFMSAKLLLAQHTFLLTDPTGLDFPYTGWTPEICGKYVNDMTYRVYMHDSANDDTFTGYAQVQYADRDSSTSANNPRLPDIETGIWTNINGTKELNILGRPVVHHVRQSLIDGYDWLRVEIVIESGAWLANADPQLSCDVFVNAYNYQRQNTFSFREQRLKIEWTDRRLPDLNSFRAPDDL